VIVCAGGVLPSGFLMDMGVTIERHFGRDKPRELIEGTPVEPRVQAADDFKPMTPDVEQIVPARGTAAAAAASLPCQMFVAARNPS
jgi:hypothetical protein